MRDTARMEPTPEQFARIEHVLPKQRGNSRSLIVWSMQEHMHGPLVMDASLMAHWRRRPTAGLIFQSDQGSRFCSQALRDTLDRWGIVGSMARKGHC